MDGRPDQRPKEGDERRTRNGGSSSIRRTNPVTKARKKRRRRRRRRRRGRNSKDTHRPIFYKTESEQEDRNVWGKQLQELHERRYTRLLSFPLCTFILRFSRNLDLKSWVQLSFNSLATKQEEDLSSLSCISFSACQGCYTHYDRERERKKEVRGTSSKNFTWLEQLYLLQLLRKDF